MEFKGITSQLRDVFRKYRYGLLVIVIGIILLLIPTKKQETFVEPPKTDNTNVFSVESRLAEILSLVDGAGDTHVLLTILSGEETIFQVDEEIHTNSDSSETKVTTIIIANKEKEQTGLVRQVIPPSYLGAIIVCRGADKPSVKLAIVDAVSKVTGLGADQISVLKMK